MQLKDITKSIEGMPTEELIERLRTIRHNRQVKRAAVVKREEVEVKREKRVRANKATSRIEDLFGEMSPEERIALLDKLQKGSADEDSTG